MNIFPTEWVDYFEFHRDGTSEWHTCQASTALKLSKEPCVVFSCILGKIDGVPCPVETLSGSDNNPAAIRAAYECAQVLYGQ